MLIIPEYNELSSNERTGNYLCRFHANQNLIKFKNAKLGQAVQIHVGMVVWVFFGSTSFCRFWFTQDHFIIWALSQENLSTGFSSR